MYLIDTAGTLIIYITHKCNLNCSYCLNHHNGSCNEQDFDYEPNYLDKLAKFVNDLKENTVHIVYFGGEPTLRWDICKDIYDYLLANSSKDLHFILQTNGTIIESIFNDLKVMDKLSISISMDADKDNHDEYRRYFDNNGSWEGIKDNVVFLLKNGFKERLQIACCCRFGDTNMADKVKFLFDELGVKKVRTTFIKEVVVKPEDMEIMLEEYKKIADYLVTHPDKLYQRFGLHTIDNEETFLSDYAQYCDNNCTDACRAGVYKLFVNTNGNIYPCHSLMEERFLLGNIFTGVINTKLAGHFEKFYNNCVSCEFKKGCIFCAYKVHYDTGSLLICNKHTKEGCKIVKEALTYYYDKCKDLNYIK